ncbi:MAG TPA: PIG-L deacetylase family protein [Acidimicrobiales bacterium]|jgi:LmbE family N-acetylglucosaminyl deacetylase|nr:PIG-L deacetylase family protein [Acidimicrobiales bacterium]
MPSGEPPPTALEPLPEDWTRALAIVAHPDDMEYGAASAVARWTAQGKDVRYVLVTKGEAGIASRPPVEVAPLRELEQRTSAAIVGVAVVEFLDHRDGLVQPGLELRRDLARAIRAHRPEVIVSINFRGSWGPGSWNHVDHRVVGEAVLDAARDAANPWLFPELRDDGLEPFATRFVAFGGSPVPSHFVDVSDWIDTGVSSLRAHATYLAGLGDGGGDPDAFLRGAAQAAGAMVGVRYATTFEVVWV